jgi:hypothetical protein
MVDVNNPLGSDFLDELYSARRDVLGDDFTRPKQMVIGRLTADGLEETVVVSGEYGRVWVREPGDDTGDALQAINTALQRHEIVFNRPVHVKKVRGELVIVARSPDDGDFEAQIPVQPQQPVRRGQVDLALIRPTMPDTSLSVYYRGGAFTLNDTSYIIADQSSYLGDSVPGSNALSIKIELDPTTGIFHETVGSSFILKSIQEAYADGDLNTTRTRGRYLYGWVRLYDDQTTIELEDILIAEEFLDTIDQASSIGVDHVSGATYDDMQDMINTVFCAGWISGGEITDVGNGTINITAGTGLIKINDNRTAPLLSIDWPAKNGLVMEDNKINIVYVGYNAGSPEVFAQAIREQENEHDQFEIYTIVREDATLHITPHRHKAGEVGRDVQRWASSVWHIQRADHEGGLILSEKGVRNIFISGGIIWIKFDDFQFNALDTSIGDSFDSYYRDGVGDWTKLASQTQWDNQHYDDGSGTLSVLAANQYAALYFYVDADNGLACLYGQAAYNNFAQANQDTPPSSVPIRLEDHGLLTGRLIFKKSDSTAQAIQSAFDTMFNPAGVVNHHDLAGLSDDDHSQYPLLAGRVGNKQEWNTSSATTSPWQMVPRNSPPSSPNANDIYLDDGTNTGSGNPGWV